MILASLLALLTFSQSTYADLKCVETYEKKKLELADTQEKYNNDEITIIELYDAKLATSKQAWDCGLVVKYNYCKYQQDLMNAKIKNLKEDATLETPQSTSKLTEDQLAAMIDFCTHPDQTHP